MIEVCLLNSNGAQVDVLSDVLISLENGTLEFAGLPDSYPRTGCEHCRYSFCVSDPMSDGLYPVPSELVLESDVRLVSADDKPIAEWDGYVDGKSAVPIYFGQYLFAVCRLDGITAEFVDGGININGNTRNTNTACETLMTMAKLVRGAVDSANEVWARYSEWHLNEKIRTAYSNDSNPNMKHFTNITETENKNFIDTSFSDSSFNEYFEPVSVCGEHQHENLPDKSESALEAWKTRQKLRWSVQLNLGYLDQHRCKQHGTPFMFSDLCYKTEKTQKDTKNVLREAVLLWERESHLEKRLNGVPSRACKTADSSFARTF